MDIDNLAQRVERLESQAAEQRAFNEALSPIIDRVGQMESLEGRFALLMERLSAAGVDISHNGLKAKAGKRS